MKIEEAFTTQDDYTTQVCKLIKEHKANKYNLDVDFGVDCFTLSSGPVYEFWFADYPEIKVQITTEFLKRNFSEVIEFVLAKLTEDFEVIMKMKKGIVVCTYNRPGYLDQCLTRLHQVDCDEIIIVMDGGSPSREENISAAIKHGFGWIELYENKGIGVVKNTGMRELMKRGCHHIFTLEEDNLIVDPDTLNKYVSYAKEHNLYHMNFGLHGTLNTGKGRYYNWKGNDVWTYPDLVGSFSYYHRDVLLKVGYIDEKFYLAAEHCEHTLRITYANMTTPFWYFADHPESGSMIEEIEGSLENSTIRNRPDFHELIRKGHQRLIEKTGTGYPPRPSQ